MHRHRTPRAIVRSQWFTDITTALRETEALLAMLEADGGFAEPMARLRLRVETVRSELELLNRVTLGEGRVLGATWPITAAAGNP
jgi:hypothetical protein